jgi:hypothetical protein
MGARLLLENPQWAMRLVTQDPLGTLEFRVLRHTSVPLSLLGNRTNPFCRTLSFPTQSAQSYLASYMYFAITRSSRSIPSPKSRGASFAARGEGTGEAPAPKTEEGGESPSRIAPRPRRALS